ncbi:MAG TPA: acyl-CoA dehydrogenase [Dehalococcoidia bacterium]|nr:acyl-CoA dehydrogenase [Dehalococcoidia bacterium]
MDLKLSEQHEMQRSMTRDFVNKEIAPIAADIDKSGEFPRDCLRKLAGLGTFGLLVPRPFGGTGPDKLGFFIANEEIAKASASISVSLIHSCLVSFFILALGTDEQKKKYLSALAKGERLGAFCIAESGSTANWALTLQTTAQADGDGYVINGSKSFISNGGEAEIYIVLARTDPAKGPMGISGLIVEKGTSGFSFGKREDKIGLRGDVTSELIFENCRVPKANMLSESIAMPMGGIMTTLALPSLGAAAVGVASAALDAAIEYVKQRTVIPGQTLANFDGVQSTIAEMASKVEASRLLVYQAGLVEGQLPDPVPGLLASIYPCRAAIEVTGDALQLIGTLGYTKDFAVERYFRDAKGLTLVGQPIEMRKLMAGKLKLGLPPMGPLPGGPPPGGPGGHAQT